MAGRKVIGCSGCGSHNPQFCVKHEKFTPLFSKEELADQFRTSLNDPQILLKQYRDLVVFLWITGQFDPDDTEINSTLLDHDKK